MRIAAAIFAILSSLFGVFFAFGEAGPTAAIVDTRPATLLCGIATLLLALPLRRRMRIVFAVAGAALILVAASWYVRYETIPVQFRSDVTLSGTLYRPRGIKRPPVVVFIHGSGRETRREGRHYAQLLVRHGIASLIYDKRGSGASGGSTWNAGYAGYARDAAAALRYVASRVDLDPDRIIVLGQSEAEWILPVALLSAPPVRAVILCSASIMTPAEQVMLQADAQLRQGRYSADTVARALTLQQRVLDYQRTGRASPGLDAGLRRASHEPWFEAAKLPERVWPIEEYRWWRGVMDFDARPYWRRVSVPVLALSGGLDRKTDGVHAQPRLRALLAEGGNGNFTGHIFPRAEHGMIEWCHGHHFPPPCWPEGLPEIMLGWLDAQLSSSRPSAAAGAGDRSASWRCGPARASSPRDPRP